MSLVARRVKTASGLRFSAISSRRERRAVTMENSAATNSPFKRTSATTRRSRSSIGRTSSINEEPDNGPTPGGIVPPRRLAPTPANEQAARSKLGVCLVPMALVVSVYVPSGIVMAADSRLIVRRTAEREEEGVKIRSEQQLVFSDNSNAV